MADDKQPAGFTAEQNEALTSIIGQQVNAILTARLATTEKKLTEKVTSSLTETLKSQLPDLLKEFRPPEPEKKDKDDKGVKSAKEDIESASMKKKMEEILAQNSLIQQRWQEERAARRTASMHTTVSEALAAHGITGAAAKGALALLKSEGRIAFQDDDSDDLVFKGEDGMATDLQIGLRQWVKTPDAAIYLPASPGRGGSGSRPGGSGMPFGGGKPTKDQQAAVLNDLLDRNL